MRAVGEFVSRWWDAASTLATSAGSAAVCSTRRTSGLRRDVPRGHVRQRRLGVGEDGEVDGELTHYQDLRLAACRGGVMGRSCLRTSANAALPIQGDSSGVCSGRGQLDVLVRFCRGKAGFDMVERGRGGVGDGRTAGALSGTMAISSISFMGTSLHALSSLTLETRVQELEISDQHRKCLAEEQPCKHALPNGLCSHNRARASLQHLRTVNQWRNSRTYPI